MRKIIFSVALALGVGLAGCGDKKPAPKPAPVKKEVVDPKAVEAKRIEETQKRVVAVLALLKTKHKELADLAPQINEIALGETKGGYLYEVVSSQGIVYTNSNVDYIFMGNLLLGQNREVRNFTARPEVQEVLAKMQAATETPGTEVFDALRNQDALPYVYGDGSNKIVVFEDPDCPSCQKLHKNFEEFGARLNLDVKVMPYILTSKHPNAVLRAKTMFCSTDPAATWKAWMLFAEGQADMDKAWAAFAKKNNLAQSDCEKAKMVDTWQVAGASLGLSATPSIMFSSGILGEGAMDEPSFVEAFKMVAAGINPNTLPAQDAAKPTAPAVAAEVVPASAMPKCTAGADPTKCTN